MQRGGAPPRSRWLAQREDARRVAQCGLDATAKIRARERGSDAARMCGRFAPKFCGERLTQPETDLQRARTY